MDYKTVGDVAEIMLNYVEQGRTYKSDKITRVPVSSYTDPARWQREMDLIFNAIADGMPAIRLAGDAERLRSGWLNGIKKLPVSYT